MTVGTDIVEIQRIRTAVFRRPGFWNRILTPGEQRYCQSKRDGIVSLAGRFAAKEAVMKALNAGLGDLAFRDIEILNDAGGVPVLNLNQKLRTRMDQMGLNRIALSISHSRDYAMAVAIGEENK